MKKGTSDNPGLAFDHFCPELGAALVKFNDAPTNDENAARLIKLFFVCQDIQDGLFGYIRDLVENAKVANNIHDIVRYDFYVWVFGLHKPIQNMAKFLKNRVENARITCSIHSYIRAYNDYPNEENARILIQEISKCESTSGFLNGWIMKRIKSPGTQKELYINVLANIYKKLHSSSSTKIANLCGYMVSTAKNELLQLVKNAKGQDTIDCSLENIEAEGSYVPLLDNPLVLEPLIDVFIKIMEPRELESWLLYYKDEYDLDEIARRMAVSRARVQNLLSQARRKLKVNENLIRNLISKLDL